MKSLGWFVAGVVFALWVNEDRHVCPPCNRIHYPYYFHWTYPGDGTITTPYYDTYTTSAPFINTNN